MFSPLFLAALSGQMPRRFGSPIRSFLSALASALLFAAVPSAPAQSQAKLRAGDAGRVAPLDQGGRAVDVSGGAVAVGAFLEGVNGDASGRVYLYEAARAIGVVRSRTALRWNPALRIVPADAGPGARFGYAVSLDSGTLAVGAATDSRIADSAGAVYVFERDHGGPGQWGQTARLTPPLLPAGQRFGFAVAVNGNTLVASAAGDGRGAVSGTAYVFERDP